MKPWARWAFAALFAAAIFGASGMEKPVPSVPAIPGLDKFLHFTAFFLFAAAVHWALRGSGARPLRAAALAAVIASLYGATDEMHQHFVPGRNAGLVDWIADSIGAAVFAAVIVLAARFSRRG